MEIKGFEYEEWIKQAPKDVVAQMAVTHRAAQRVRQATQKEKKLHDELQLATAETVKMQEDYAKEVEALEAILDKEAKP